MWDAQDAIDNSIYLVWLFLFPKAYFAFVSWGNFSWMSCASFWIFIIFIHLECINSSKRKLIESSNCHIYHLTSQFSNSQFIQILITFFFTQMHNSTTVSFSSFIIWNHFKANIFTKPTKRHIAQWTFNDCARVDGRRLTEPAKFTLHRIS